ncbi:MAG TPA: N-acyl homoserine lactonase family protein [Bosea sp. (in: a-proteobacteria)]|jgi:glyoxylase-like metal-dependent hydrolase (beta-lactamase superfamily II)|uniref:N-acyl homoserine lactonase family protein n=1 Tax=Bosea sp. (in: a-proteobacteria) TaxID=1871050 RepID=UPI002E16733E|nr:N-acyl homoserine lactonase family protein [Bosea sp. (in: a-proteobacteria)]
MTGKDHGLWEIHAIRYATNAVRTRNLNFIKDTDPGAVLAMDFYCWLLVGEQGAIVVDTGMAPQKAARFGHEILASPPDVMAKLGVEPAAVETVIMTHLHYDHTGHSDHFPAARFLLQAEEMAYVAGPHMERAMFRHAYEADELQKFLGYLHAGRLHLHGRDFQVADGVSVHWVGGHTAGQEVVRVRTSRGWVVLASDALHYEEELIRGVPFAVVFNIADMLAAHDRIRELADSDDHVVVAHDPLVVKRYPSARDDLAGIAVRVDLPPSPSVA